MMLSQKPAEWTADSQASLRRDRDNDILSKWAKEINVDSCKKGQWLQDDGSQLVSVGLLKWTAGLWIDFDC